MIRAALLAALALVAAGCGGSGTPAEEPGAAATRFLGAIVHNRYDEAWDELYAADRKVAPRAEYVGCESRSPVITAPTKVEVVRVREQSTGIGDGTFVDSTAVALRLRFPGGFQLVHTVHLIRDGDRWRWILPPHRFRDYKADRCPTDPGSTESSTS